MTGCLSFLSLSCLAGFFAALACVAADPMLSTLFWLLTALTGACALYSRDSVRR